jgi:hypothetical protein
MKGLFRNFSYSQMIDPEVLDWYELAEAERFSQSLQSWHTFLLLRGDYDPEPDTQSPFSIFKTSC